MTSKVDQIIEARDEILRPPGEHNISGDRLAPGPYTVIPSRAMSDKRMHDHPAAFMVLCALCGHQNAVSGVAFPNQLSLAQRLGKTQQAVSRQMRNLIEWGYIQKVVKENRLRKTGRRGATWRVIFDPAATDDDIVALGGDEHIEQNIINETLKAVDNSNDVQHDVVKQADSESAFTTSGGCMYKQQHDVVSNTSTNNENKNIENLEKKMCSVFAHALDNEYKSRGEWRWTAHQESIAREIAETGVTLKQWTRTIQSSVKWHKDKGLRPPFSLGFYRNSFTAKKKTEEMSAEDIIKKTTRSLRMSRVYKN